MLTLVKSMQAKHAARECRLRLEKLAAVSDQPDGLTRLFLSPAHQRAVEFVRGWMQTAGMETHIDAAANVVGRYEGSVRGAPALLLGSHIDTVCDAGRYDGTLGVLAAIAAVDAIASRGLRLPFAIEVIAFGDEEGVRFPTTLTGSRALAGTFDPAAGAVEDANGVTLAQALDAFGCDAAAIPCLARRREDVVAYVEVHIEQGPVLEREGLSLGVVTAINALRRARIQVDGEAGHAGTVPMKLRRDALAAAAEMVLAIETYANQQEALVATVGMIEAKPGAPNVIAGSAQFSLDVRSPCGSLLADAFAVIERTLDAIAARRKIRVTTSPSHAAPATDCSPDLVDMLSMSVTDLGLPVRHLSSGAGHDASALATLCPIGMLFVRCKAGISHNPSEFVAADDIDTAIMALIRFIERLTERERRA